MLNIKSVLHACYYDVSLMPEGHFVVSALIMSFWLPYSG